MTFPPKVWQGVLRLIQADVPEYSSRAWLEPLVPSVDGDVLHLGCPSSFHRDRVRDHYLPRIIECAQREAGRPISVELAVGSPAGATAPLVCRPSEPEVRAVVSDVAAARPAGLGSETAARSAVATGGTTTPISPTPLVAKRVEAVAAHASSLAPGPARSTALPPRYQATFGNFVVGRCNSLAREAALALASERQLSLNQLYIASSPGLGKTHLSRAVVAEATHRCQGRALYTSAESFTNDFMSSVRGGQMAGFKQRYRRGQHLLVIEDLQFLAGKAKTQLELFYTIRHVVDAGGRVLLTGDRLPREMTALDEQLRAQIEGSFVARLEPPDAKVRREILRSKAAGGGFRIPDESLDVLVDRVRGSVRDLESVLIQLVTTASLLKKPIDFALTLDVLATRVDGAPQTTARLDLAGVTEVVAAFFKTTPETLASRSRRRDVLVPRQLAMYFCHRYTTASLAEIGRAFNRSHPSVKNAIDKVERDITERAPVRYKVEALVERLDQMVDD